MIIRARALSIGTAVQAFLNPAVRRTEAWFRQHGTDMPYRFFRIVRKARRTRYARLCSSSDCLTRAQAIQ